MTARDKSLTMGPLEWGLLIALSLVWGGAFLFGKIAVSEVPPLTVVLIRVGLAAAALYLVLRVLAVGVPRSLAEWRRYAVMGFFNNAIPFGLIFWGQVTIGAGLASILNATTPLFTVILAHFWTDNERMGARKLFAVLLGLIGVVVLIGPEAVAGIGTNVLAQLAIVGAAISYAIAGIYGRRFAGEPPMRTAFGQVAASSLMMLPVVLLVDQPWRLAAPSAEVVAALVALALVSTALAYILYFRILAAAGATNVLLVTFLIPVSAVLLGWVVLGERLQASDFTGMAVIMVALTVLDGRALAGLRRIFGRRPAPSRLPD